MPLICTAKPEDWINRYSESTDKSSDYNTRYNDCTDRSFDCTHRHSDCIVTSLECADRPLECANWSFEAKRSIDCVERASNYFDRPFDCDDWPSDLAKPMEGPGAEKRASSGGLGGLATMAGLQVKTGATLQVHPPLHTPLGSRLWKVGKSEF